MVGVGIVFKNGVKTYFRAQEFSIDPQPRADQSSHDTREFRFKDESGNEAPLYLKLDEVAGIMVTPIVDGEFSFQLI